MALKHHAAPIFLDFGPARRDGAPTAPGGRPFCEPTTHGCPVLEPDVGPIAPCLSNRCQPAPERGRGGFRMGRTQPHQIAGHGPAAAPIFSTQPPVMLSACSGPPGQKATQPAPRRAAHGQKGFAGPFHTKLRRAHDFGGHVP